MMAKEFLAGGTAYVKEKINEAIANESRTATISGCWEIESEIRLPSNFTLILKDCHLKLADKTFCNILFYLGYFILKFFSN